MPKRPHAPDWPHLRELRRRRRLSSRALAARAGVSHSTISLIERDRMSPSADTLGAIVDASGTTLVEFFSGLKSIPGARPVYHPDEFTEIGKPDEISCRVIGFDQPARAMQLLVETCAAHADTGEILGHDAQEGGLVLKGRIELTVTGRVWLLEVEHGCYFDNNLPHRFRNPDPYPARIVSAITPPDYQTTRIIPYTQGIWWSGAPRGDAQGAWWRHVRAVRAGPLTVGVRQERGVQGQRP